MATDHLHCVVEHLRRAAAPREEPGLTDGVLLERFVSRRDAAALEALVRRHGPMVLGVCRRVLGNAHDAEDAFQATFLVLVRRAASLGRPELVGNFLYGVAYRTALKARTAAVRRRLHERQMMHRQQPHTEGPGPWEELRPLLDQELERLPAKYRVPVVLCELEGRPRKEVARLLGLPEGTLSSRLATARKLLGQRLTRRGVALSATGLSLALGQGAAPACVPAALVASTVRAGLLAAAGRGLATGMCHVLALTRLQLATAVLLAAGVLAAGWGALTPAAPEAPAARAAATDPDSDGDGLSDFQEVHKYRTYPHKKSTDGSGVSDGDWAKRREHTYSVRAVIRLMPPYSKQALNDDYQDARVLRETKDYVDLEVITYPLNTNAEAIPANANWKKDYAGMKEYLAPGVATNWDEAMRKDLVAELARDSIDIDKLTDREVVEKVSRWLFEHTRQRDMFCTHFVHFPSGKPAIFPGLEGAFYRGTGERTWTDRDQFEHELLGRQMYRNKTCGTCTSAAVYQCTALRALGIPTRMILCIPIADASDDAQVEMVERNLTNHRVRSTADLGLVGAGTAYAAHTFLEVYVGGRWRRLNYTKLGQNILDPRCLGLMVHVLTFRDLSEANLAATWGARYAKGQRDKVFRHSNPYRTLELSDSFGRHAGQPNPPADKEHKHITIGKGYWFGSKETPAFVQNSAGGGGVPGAGRLLIHGEEWFDDAGDYLQYKVFMRRADRDFVFRAPGRPDVKGHITMSFWTAPADKVRELELEIPPDEFAKMAKGVPYTLHPVNANPRYQWKVGPGLTITRQ
jgi:RNA polymerase sigma factor (sigma-70 family)